MALSNSSQIRERLIELLAKRRNYQQEIKDLVKQYEVVVFYGCGIILNRIIDTWKQHIGRKIDFCCDQDSMKWGKSFRGIKCISPDELMAIKDKCAVFVTVGNFKPVFEYLKNNGVSAVNQIYKYDIVTAEFLQTCSHDEVLERLCEVYKLLFDTKSIKVFDSIINRILNSGFDINVMENVCEDNQYFPSDIIKLNRNESFVDIGAFDGDSVKDIVKRTRGQFDNIFSFELDLDNFKLLQENVNLMPERDRIKIFNLGIWDCKCDIAYSTGNSDSTIGEGEARGHVAPLDQVLKNKKVTYIKMDVEGSELQALQGSREIIKTQKPKLAICIYHDFKHLWEIPLYLKELVPEYKIYLRHHTKLEYETVCYAII
ncbi:MAG: FkbM family methyltransferase [Candidatus Omnitrophica bacterium]|nr:FkbM family methyltransferase [Candidatus Omnitrophota bacterium]